MEFLKKIFSNKYFTRFLVYMFLGCITLITLFPFWNMIISSTHNNLNITTKFNIWVGEYFTANYLRLTQNIDIWNAFKNSLILATSSTVLGIYFAALAAYSFSKLEYKGRNQLFMLVLISIMIPGQLSMIGFYKEIIDLGLINSYVPLIIPSMANCFAIFFFKQYIDANLPNEIIEAATIDGCNEIRVFHTIALPLMMPAIATMGIVTFIGSWNSYLRPLMILNDTAKMPMPVVIASIRSASGAAEYGAQYVGILISIIPIIIIFSLFSRLILDKVSIGSAVKG